MDILAPSRTDFRKRILYDTYDVTAELKNGMNALGIMLGNGWFNGQKKYWGWQMQWYGSPRVILQLEIEYEDGSKGRVVTDKNWKASWSPITFNCLFDGEHYDARLEQDIDLITAVRDMHDVAHVELADAVRITDRGSGA